MELKSVNLTMVNTEALIAIFTILFEYEPLNPKVKYFKQSIEIGNIASKRYTDEVIIDNKGNIYQYCNGEPVSMDNQQQSQHLLLETQWIKEREKVPKCGQKIVLKAKTVNDGFVIYNCELFSEPPKEEDGGWPMIYYTAENNSDGISFDLFDTEIIGWIPANNVIL